MTKVAILPVLVGDPADTDGGSDRGGITFHAVAGDKQSRGRTAGQALDALTAQLPGAMGDATLVIVQSWQPDEFFNAVQQHRLAELMSCWRAARDDDGSQKLSPMEVLELEGLVEAELRASARRASALADAAG